MNRFHLGLGAGLLLGVLSLFLCVSHFKAQIRALKPTEVQVIHRDTITLEKPLEIEKTTRDTIFVELRDTIRLRDTLFVRLEREQKIYADTNYRAVISGYLPCLDTISVYPLTITKTSTRKEWRKINYGLQAGMGIVMPLNSNPSFGGYVGFGVCYKF